MWWLRLGISIERIRLGSKNLSRLVHKNPQERRRHCDSTGLRLAAIGRSFAKGVPVEAEFSDS